MASWKVLVVAVILGNVVTGLSFRSTEDDDDDDSFGYMFPPMTFLPITAPVKPTPPKMLRHHNFHHNFMNRHHHAFPDFVTADSVMDEKPNSNEDMAGVAVRTTSGDGDNDGSTMVTNDDGEVKSASTGKAHNMRHRIKVPKIKKTPGNHHTGYSFSSSTKSETKNGKTKSEAASSTTAVDDDKVEHEDVMMKKKDKDFMNDDDDSDDNDNDDWMKMKIRKPTKPKMLDLHFPGLSAADIMDAKPSDDEEVAGFAVRKTSGDEDGNDGTTMVTNNDGDVKRAKTGKAKHNMRKDIEMPTLKTGDGNHFVSYSKSSSTSSHTVNGKTVTEGESSTSANNDGKEESEHTKMMRKDKGFRE